MSSLVRNFRKHLKPLNARERKAISLPPTVLQTWWVVEKCVDGPESGNMFCHVVGTVKEEVKNLPKQYRQKPVLVLTQTVRSRSGISLDFRPQFSLGPVEIVLSPIDYDYKIFDDWD